MEQENQPAKQTEEIEDSKIELPLNPKTDKPYKPEEIAKVLLNTKPKELDAWQKARGGKK